MTQHLIYNEDIKSKDLYSILSILFAILLIFNFKVFQFENLILSNKNKCRIRTDFAPRNSHFELNK